MEGITAAISRKEWKTARGLADSVARGKNPKLGRLIDYGPIEAEKTRVWRRAYVLHAAALSNCDRAELNADMAEVARLFRETEVKHRLGGTMDRAASLITSAAFLLGDKTLGEAMFLKTTDQRNFVTLTAYGMLHGKSRSFAEINQWIERQDSMTRCIILYGVSAGLAQLQGASK